VFNGLVGYGQYIVDRNDNHYCGAKSTGNNNFFIEPIGSVGTKRWLWNDIEDTSDSVQTSTTDRVNMFEAVMKDGNLTLTADFNRMVFRRQQKPLNDVEQATADDIVNIFTMIEESRI